MKKEKGITLVSLVITILLMLILAGVTIGVGTDTLEKVKLQDVREELEIISTEIDIIEAPSQYKNVDEFIEYTPEQLKTNFNISNIIHNVQINWKTKTVKITYNGQDYTKQKYQAETESKERNIDFDLSVTYVDNRYRVNITPNFENTQRNANFIQKSSKRTVKKQVIG